MPVTIILPDIETVTLHAVRRVAAFPDLKSANRLTEASLIIRDAARNGIIRLTFTA
jgi:hypothetical protein